MTYLPGPWIPGAKRSKPCPQCGFWTCRGLMPLSNVCVGSTFRLWTERDDAYAAGWHKVALLIVKRWWLRRRKKARAA